MNQNQRENDGIEIDLKDVLMELWSKLPILILEAIIGGLLMFLYSSIIEKPVYQSTTKMYVISRITNGDDDTLTQSDLSAGTQLTKDYEQVIKSRNVLESAIARLQLYDGDKMMNYASEGLAQSKPTKGFGAWLGQQIPMILPTAAAIGLSAVTKNPKYAEWIGKGSFGIMAASSAGEAMNQAREYGATDNEVWAAGFTDAAIMYAAGKIPFNRYTGRLFNGARKQAAAGGRYTSRRTAAIPGSRATTRLLRIPSATRRSCATVICFFSPIARARTAVRFSIFACRLTTAIRGATVFASSPRALRIPT